MPRTAVPTQRYAATAAPAAAATYAPASSRQAAAHLSVAPQATSESPFSRMRNMAGNFFRGADATAGSVATAAGNRPGAVYAATSNVARTVSRPVATVANRATTGAHNFWTAHISQFRNGYNPNGPSMAPNCGPASVTIALRLVGLDIPGFNGQRDQRVIDRARIIATGRNDTRVGTTDTELERVIQAAGGRWSESTNLSQMLGWVRQGTPVILAGNPSQAWNRRYSPSQVYPFNGGHWVTVSGYDQRSGYYVVNDPLSAIGPIYVSEGELATYFSRNGGLGIGVYR